MATGSWGYDPSLGGVRGKGGKARSLQAAVAQLSPIAKSAFLAAANNGLIKRRTWNGCAFNAGGAAVGEYVGNSSKAAMVFKMPTQRVNEFIAAWDSLPGNDFEATEKLIQAIEKVGLSTEPHHFREDTGRPKKYTVVKRVFTSEETRVREEFDRLMAENKVEFAAEAEAILCGATV